MMSITGRHSAESAATLSNGHGSVLVLFSPLRRRCLLQALVDKSAKLSVAAERLLLGLNDNLL